MLAPNGADDYTDNMIDKRLDGREGRLTRLGHAVSAYLAAGGHRERSHSSLCAELWPQVVGQWYSERTRVVRLRGTELSVWCDSASLAQQLHLDQGQVIERLNQRLGGEYIATIRAASVGPQRERDKLAEPPVRPGPSPDELAAVVLTKDDLAACARLAAAIPDEALRETFRRLLEDSCRLRQWRLTQGCRPCSHCGALHHEPGPCCFTCLLLTRPAPSPGTSETDSYYTPD